MFTITKRIEIDYGHRVMSHGGKCRSIHGHRGAIEATCSADNLHDEGVQTDMVLDFGFLKEIMMEEFHEPCDHGFIAYVKDIQVLEMFSPRKKITETKKWIKNIEKWMETHDFLSVENTKFNTKLYVVNFTPTSERLAEHFYFKLVDRVEEKSEGLATLTNIRFWETPTSASDYPGFPSN